MLMEEERIEVVKYGRKLIEEGLTRGSGGNVSIYNRDQGLVAISPSGQDYFETRPEDVVIVDLDGNIVDGEMKPSSELGMHLIFYRNREEINGIVHTHSKYATAIASMGKGLPAVHYLVAMAGLDVKCAPYALYGSEELAKNAYEAMGNRKAVLLENHGLIALGKDVDNAFSIANQLEFVSEVYYLARTMGDIKILPEEEVLKVMKKFDTYQYR